MSGWLSPLSGMALRVTLSLLLLIGVVWALANFTALDFATVDAWVKDAGVAGPLVFMGIYALGTVCLVPGPLFLLIGGALYGPYYGTFYSLTGTMIGSALAFLLARFIATDWLEARIGGRLQRLKQGVEQEGWRFVAFLRLVPVAPSVIINYALGLTRIKFSHFFLASYICKIPLVAAYVTVGHAGLEVINSTDDFVPTVLIGLALLGAVLFLPRLIVRLRRDPPLSVAELNSKLRAGEKILLLNIRNLDEIASEQAHSAGAMEIAIEDIEQHLDDLADYIERPIAIFSHDAKLAARAAEVLASHGFAHVQMVQGNIADACWFSHLGDKRDTSRE